MIVVAAAILALASPVVDRTVVCTMVGAGLPDPYRALDVDVSNRSGRNSPIVQLGNEGNDSMRAGFHTGPYAFGQRKVGELWLSRTGCTATTRRVDLSSTGLRGGRVAGFTANYACEVPAKVLLRMRAVFTRPVTLRVERGFWVAHGNMTTAAVAVTTLDRRPILFASADREGARLFTSRARCVQE